MRWLEGRQAAPYQGISELDRRRTYCASPHVHLKSASVILTLVPSSIAKSQKAMVVGVVVLLVV